MYVADLGNYFVGARDNYFGMNLFAVQLQLICLVTNYFCLLIYFACACGNLLRSGTTDAKHQHALRQGATEPQRKSARGVVQRFENQLATRLREKQLPRMYPIKVKIVQTKMFSIM